jgi:hypothetical protein
MKIKHIIPIVYATLLFLLANLSLASVPSPRDTTAYVYGTVGSDVNLNVDQYFYAGTSDMNNFLITDPLHIPAGVFFNNNGYFTGTYLKPGKFLVHVRAHNVDGWSPILPVLFTINQPG